jgi:hypothetical protein
VRKIAKLTLFFSLNFIIIFAAVTCIKFLSLRVEWAKVLPPKPETILTLIIAAAHWALSLALFSSILITLNYIVRRTISPLIAISFVMIFSFLISFGISAALEQWKAVPPAYTAGVKLGERGMILSNSLNKNNTAVVLLNGSSEPLGPRVTSIPGQPLVFHRSINVGYNDNFRPASLAETLPPVPFGDDTPVFLRNISIDIRLHAGILQQKYREGFLSYLFYTGLLIFLLCSLGYAVKFSVWPLANLFLCTLAFGGILSFITFFNSPEMRETTSSFLNNRLPVSFALPLIFLGVGLLVSLYSLLIYASKRRYSDDV